MADPGPVTSLFRRPDADANPVTLRTVLCLSVLACLLAAASAVAAFRVAPGSPEPVGEDPSSMAAGDLDGDGDRDLLTANLGSDDVTVLLGDGRGGFTEAAASPVPAGRGPVSVTLADFDADGDRDAAVANLYSANITVLLGDGAGSLVPHTVVPVGAEAIAVGDLDRDGRADLAAAGSGEVTVLFGDGAGGFSAAPGGPEPVRFAADLLVEDVNGDGVPDVAAGSGSQVVALLGDGTGDLRRSTGSPVNVRDSVRDLVTGDFDTDGRRDLAVGNIDLAGRRSGLEVLLGDGQGGFRRAPSGPEPLGGVEALARGDFDRDGHEDLAAAGEDGVTILSGDGTGDLSPRAAVGERLGTPTDLVAERLDRRGGLDLALSGPRRGGSVTVLLDEVPPPTVTGRDVRVPEGDSGTRSARFELRLSRPSDRPVSVGYRTVDGSASAPRDYRARTGTVTFEPGRTTAQVAVPVSGDRRPEGDERFGLRLEQPRGARLGDPLARATIVDDDVPACTIEGTGRGEVLRGTPGDDLICARGGDDVVLGAGGDDIIIAGPGRDVLLGGAGRDTIDARDDRGARDVVLGGSGQDACRTDAGDVRVSC